MAVTNVTWGITSAIVLAYIGQYKIDDDDFAVTEDAFAALLAHASAHVNGYIIEGGLDLATIAADTASVAYIRVQGITAKLVAAYALRSSRGEEAEVAEALVKECQDELDRILATPALIGEGPAQPSRVWTTSDGLGLDTSEAARAARRVFGEATGRLTENDDTFYF